MTSEDVASKAGCSFSTVSQWLAGKRVSPHTFEGLAKALGLKVDELTSLLSSDEQRAVG